MNESRKTVYYIGVAVLLAVLAFIMAPKRITPDAFLEQGEPFFPEFTDPNEATTLEVISFDENTGKAVPFKVTFENGRWLIPSHHNYLADGKDRLAQTAAGVIDIKKDDIRSDNSADHEKCGVIDPLDETASLTGRGRRIKVKKGEQILADLIVGKQLEGRPNIRFVRLPNQKRVYTSKINLDISTKFEDWIETDLLKTMKHRISKVILKDYSINERTRSMDNRDILTLTVADEIWKANSMPSSKAVDTVKMQELLNTLDSLEIVGVRPKPKGLSANLKVSADNKQLQNSDIRSLQSKGFYLSRDRQLLSNEGELQFETTDGLIYTLRFGEVVYGQGLAVTAGTEDASGNQTAENRFLFITTEFNGKMFKEPKRPQNRSFLDKPDSLFTSTDIENKKVYDDHAKWEREVANAKNQSSILNAGFAEWYYVISSESFDKLHLKRADLLISN